MLNLIRHVVLCIIVVTAFLSVETFADHQETLDINKKQEDTDHARRTNEKEPTGVSCRSAEDVISFSIQYIVIHATENSRTSGAVESFLTNDGGDSVKSTHYIVANGEGYPDTENFPEGAIIQLVEDDRAAWTNAVRPLGSECESSTLDEGPIHEGNSISIEFVGEPQRSKWMTGDMYEVGAELVSLLAEHYGISKKHIGMGEFGIDDEDEAEVKSKTGIIGHDQIRNKTDPCGFDDENDWEEKECNFDWDFFMECVLHGGCRPPSPSSLEATVVSNSQIDLSWRFDTDPRVPHVEFRILRQAELPGGETEEFVKAVDDPDKREFSDTGLKPDTRYCYQIVAVDEDDDISEFSGEVCGVTGQVGEPDTPVIGLVLDKSGSMSGEKLNRTQIAASFLTERTRAGEKLTISAFNDRGQVVSDLKTISSDAPDSQTKNEIIEAINDLNGNGDTNFGAGLRVALEQLRSGSDTGPVCAILMSNGKHNTGNFTDEVEEFENEGWPIHTIAFGSDVNADSLENIAATTGGQFFPAPGSEERIQDTFARVQNLCRGSSEVSFIQDIVTQGQELIKKIPGVDSAVRAVEFLLTWGGSDLDLILISPTGREITPAEASSDQRVMFRETSVSEYYLVKSPNPGEWRTKVVAKDVSQTEKFNLSVTTDSPTGVSANFAGFQDEYDPGETIPVKVVLQDDNRPVTGASVHVTVNRPSGPPLPLLNLADDGAHNDGTANDGVYGASFTSDPDAEGIYTIQASASTNGANQNLSHQIQVGEPSLRADVGITKTVNNTVAQPGGNVTYTLTVSNNGPGPATNVEVTEELSDKLALQAGIASQGNYEPDSGMWSVGSLSKGDSAQLTLETKIKSKPFESLSAAQVSPDPAQTIFNTAQVDLEQTDPNSNNDSASVTVQVEIPRDDIKVIRNMERCISLPGRDNLALKFLLLRNEEGDPTGDVTIERVEPASDSDWQDVGFKIGEGRLFRDRLVAPVIVRGSCTGTNLALKITFSNGATLSASRAAMPSLHEPGSLRLSLRSDLLAVRAYAPTTRHIKTEVYNLSGRLIMEARSHGHRLVTLLRDTRGRPLANGIYLAAITVKHTDGTVDRKIKKLMVMR